MHLAHASGAITFVRHIFLHVSEAEPVADYPTNLPKLAAVK